MYENFVSSFLTEKHWKYLRELYAESSPRLQCSIASEFFQISPSIENVKHVFVYLKKAYRNANDSRQKKFTIHNEHICFRWFCFVKL